MITRRRRSARTAKSEPTLGMRVMKERRALALTQAELGELVGLTRSQISRIENDRLTTEPHDNTMRLLAEVLDMPFDELMALLDERGMNGPK